jgi:hypothetical protein
MRTILILVAAAGCANNDSERLDSIEHRVAVLEPANQPRRDAWWWCAVGNPYRSCSGCELSAFSTCFREMDDCETMFRADKYMACTPISAAWCGADEKSRSGQPGFCYFTEKQCGDVAEAEKRSRAECHRKRP